MYFALDTAVKATGFRIFKDMLNRTFYKRISKANTTEITNDVVEGFIPQITIPKNDFRGSSTNRRVGDRCQKNVDITNPY